MRSALVAACAVLIVSVAAAQETQYAAPDGAFAIRPPAGWSVTRTQVGREGFSTAFAAGPDEAAAKIDIVSFALAVNLATVDDVAEVLLTPILQNLQAQGQIISQRTRRMKVGGFPAIRYDMVYQSRAEAEAEQGYMMAILGKRFALLAAVSARRSDEVNRHAGEAAMATLAIESTTPGKAPR